MDLVLLGKGLDYAKQKKRCVLVLGAMGLTVYGVYRAYNLPYVARKRQRLLKLLGTFVSVAEMAIDSAEGIGVLSKDLKQFFQSNCDQIPQSLNQIFKIAKSDEVLMSLIGLTRAVTVGVLGGFGDEMIKGGEKSFPDRVVDKMLSDAGCGFASVVVGSFARNLIMGLFSELEHGRGSSYPDNCSIHLDSKTERLVSRWVEIASQDKCREFIGDCIRVFVSTAMMIYLEKTININTYDEFFSGLTNPKHIAEARDLLRYVSMGAVETFVQTCHSIWATKLKSNSGYSKIDFEDGITKDEKGSNAIFQGKPRDKNEDRGWLSQIPYRKVALDMTGTVTFEMVRSCLEFLLEKLLELIRGTANIFQQKVERGIEAVRHATCKSSTVTTVCFNLCLNILDSPWILASQ